MVVLHRGYNVSYLLALFDKGNKNGCFVRTLDKVGKNSKVLSNSPKRNEATISVKFSFNKSEIVHIKYQKNVTP